MGSIITRFHTRITVHTQTVGMLYTVRLCPSVSFSCCSGSSSSCVCPGLSPQHQECNFCGVPAWLSPPCSHCHCLFSIVTPAVVLLSFFILAWLCPFLPFAILLISTHLSPTFFQDSYAPLFPGLLFNPISAHSPVSLLILSLPINAMHDE